MRAAIIGHRSWIAQHLIGELRRYGEHEVNEFGKDSALTGNFSEYDCLYVFPGRSRPTSDEMFAERVLIGHLTGMASSRHPRRIVVLGSTAPYYTEYGEHKRWVENRLMESWRTMPETVILKAPVVFGPGQPIDSTMLVPSLAREGKDLMLLAPSNLTKMIHVSSLVEHMAKFVNPNYFDHNAAGAPDSIYNIPGTFAITPRQLKDLYDTWESYRSRSG